MFKNEIIFNNFYFNNIIKHEFACLDGFCSGSLYGKKRLINLINDAYKMNFDFNETNTKLFNDICYFFDINNIHNILTEFIEKSLNIKIFGVNKIVLFRNSNHNDLKINTIKNDEINEMNINNNNFENIKENYKEIGKLKNNLIKNIGKEYEEENFANILENEQNLNNLKNNNNKIEIPIIQDKIKTKNFDMNNKDKSVLVHNNNISNILDIYFNKKIIEYIKICENYKKDETNKWIELTEKIKSDREYFKDIYNDVEKLMSDFRERNPNFNFGNNKLKLSKRILILYTLEKLMSQSDIIFAINENQEKIIAVMLNLILIKIIDTQNLKEIYSSVRHDILEFIDFENYNKNVESSVDSEIDYDDDDD